MIAATVGLSHAGNEPATVKNLMSIWHSRNRLLCDGGIAEILLQQLPNTCPVITSHYTPSYIYGDTMRDIAIMCLPGELCSYNEELFDVGLLQSSMTFVEKNTEQIGLVVEDWDVPQKGMVRSNQQQGLLS